MSKWSSMLTGYWWRQRRHFQVRRINKYSNARIEMKLNLIDTIFQFRTAWKLRLRSEKSRFAWLLDWHLSVLCWYTRLSGAYGIKYGTDANRNCQHEWWQESKRQLTKDEATTRQMRKRERERERERKRREELVCALAKGSNRERKDDLCSRQTETLMRRDCFRLV